MAGYKVLLQSFAFWVVEQLEIGSPGLTQTVPLGHQQITLKETHHTANFNKIYFASTAISQLILSLIYFNHYCLFAFQPQVKAEDVLSTVELLARDLPRCAELLTIAPQFKRQQDSYDKVLRIITHLLHLITKLPTRQDFQVRADVMRKKFLSPSMPGRRRGKKVEGRHPSGMPYFWLSKVERKIFFADFTFLLPLPFLCHRKYFLPFLSSLSSFP